MPFLQLSKLGAHIKEAAKEAGNVLFMILIAVALFAALAYAVTQSTRSGGGDASKETTVLQASQIMQYSAEVQTAIMRMKLSNGCTDGQISFENSFDSRYINSNAPTNYTCHVFRPEGGNISYQLPPKDIYYDTNTADYRFVTGNNLHISGVGLPNNGDLWLVIMGTINSGNSTVVTKGKALQNVCIQINAKLGIPVTTGSWTNFPQIVSDSPFAVRFVGTYTDNTSMTVSGLPYSAQEFCVEGATPGYIYYARVLIPR